MAFGWKLHVILSFFFILAAINKGVAGYKHVVFMHGILAGPDEFDYFATLVKQAYPGTPVTQIDAFNHLESLTTMWDQVDKISKLVSPILTNSSSGTVLVCFSQGGLICRGLLATIPHNVETFISLSSPLAGQFGDTDYLKFFFPYYVKENIYKLFYTEVGQVFSVGGYWKDPHEQKLFQKFSTYLATLNNQSDTFNPKSHEFKENFLRLKNIVMVGGPDDGVITPWQSSQFGMYNASEKVLPMEKQEWYLNDAFGLQTLAKRGGLHLHTIPGIHHVRWHKELQIFKCCVLPWLT